MYLTATPATPTTPTAPINRIRLFAQCLLLVCATALLEASNLCSRQSNQIGLSRPSLTRTIRSSVFTVVWMRFA